MNRMVPLLSNAGTDDDPSRVVIVGSIAGIGVPHVGEHGTIMVCEHGTILPVGNLTLTV